MKSDLLQRIGVAIVGIPLILYICYTGGFLLFILLGLISIIGMWEYNSMLVKTSPFIRLLDVLISFVVFIITTNIFGNDLVELVATGLLFSLLIIKFIIRVALYTNPEESKIYLRPFWGWFYTGFLPGLIYRLGSQYSKQQYLLILVVLIWITDSAAYFIGMKFGKHRGIFKVSPKKSLEGFLAGLIMPFLAVVIINKYLAMNDIKNLLILAFCAGVIGQLGDLLESKLKRTAGVKDSSNFIPGHGGVLDRFDSLLLAAPVFWIILKLIP